MIKRCKCKVWIMPCIARFVAERHYFSDCYTEMVMIFYWASTFFHTVSDASFSSMIFKVLISTECLIDKRTQTHGKMDGFRFPHLIYRVSPSLEAPNYFLCIQSNSAGFSFINSGKQVNLKHSRRRFERNLLKDMHHRSVPSRNWLKS